jgi:hypothetical protein
MKDAFARPPYLILFFGPDGSGKSSLAQGMAENLRDKGLRVKVSWMRGTHTFASFIALFLSKFKTFQGTDNPYYKIRIPPPMKRFWQILEFFSAMPVILFRYFLQKLFGVSVIGERCFLDLIVWVAMVTQDESYVNGFSSRFLNSLALKSYARVYVTADVNTLLRRRNDVSAEILSKQQRLYERVSITSKAFTLDTTGKSVDDSLQRLKIQLAL